MIIQIINTSYYPSMLSGGLIDGKPGFAAWQYAQTRTQAALIDALAATGLRGRSGISRPVAAKWGLCAAQAADDKLVVMNTIDGDPNLPAAAALLASNPGGVIEGLMIAARAVGASEAIICLAKENKEQQNALKSFLDDCHASGLLNGCKIGLAQVQAKYVAREDTALLAALEGKPAMSGLTPPMPAERGFAGRPSLVHSAETFAQIAAIFRQLAEGKPPVLTRLFALGGEINIKGIFEAGQDLTLRAAYEDLGKGLPEGKTLKFLQVGGQNGFLFTGEELDIVINDAEFEASGRWLSNPSILARDSGTCVVDYVKKCADFAEKASCGKCVMGREGTWQLREFISDMTTGKSKNDDLDMIREISEGIRAGALCPVCQSAGAPVLSALERFAGEFDQHMKRRKCPTLVCNKYVTFHIMPDKCNGCGECLPKCPVGAIAGAEGLIHVIDQDTCNYCGICETVCKPIAQAVARAGLVKPQTPEEPIPVGDRKSVV